MGTLLLLDITTRFVSLRLKSCVTWQPIFLPLWVETVTPLRPTSRAFLAPLALKLTPKTSVVISQLKGKNIFDVMAEGKTKLAEMPAGGVGGGSGGAAPAAAAPVEVKEEKKPVEESEESDSDMGMGLFD